MADAEPKSDPEVEAIIDRLQYWIQNPDEYRRHLRLEVERNENEKLGLADGLQAQREADPKYWRERYEKLRRDVKATERRRAWERDLRNGFILMWMCVIVTGIMYLLYWLGPI
jgi:hypothetical protein